MTARGVIAAGLLAAVLGACSSTPPPEPADPVRAQAEQVARFAFDRQRYDLAARLYARALERAYQRDELPAIRDLGTAEALALLRAGRAGEALAAAQRTAAELTRRGLAVPARLTLIQAQAHHATGSLSATDRAARRVLETDSLAPLRARAHYLRGLVAADRGDRAALQRAHAAIAGASAPALRADRAVLAGRIATQARDRPGAYRAYLLAAELRRSVKDEVGMAHALAEAAAQAPDGSTAADLYLRAGRTADLLGRTDRALAWLCAALDRSAADDDVAIQARSRLDARTCDDGAEPTAGAG